MGVIRILATGELWRLRKYRIWKTFLDDYRYHPGKFFQTAAIHRRGFTRSDWEILELNKENYNAYLSSRSYTALHPMNGYYSKLIDDKMVIKYIFSGTSAEKLLPEYYYLIDESGVVFPMMDLPHESGADVSAIRALLKDKGRLALKLVTGFVGQGFYKLVYQNGAILVSGKEMSESDFMSFLLQCKNYIITEFLLPHPDLAAYWPYTANTIRYLLGRVGNEWRMIRSFVRFGTEQSGEVENLGRGGVLCYIDENGFFEKGYLLQKRGNKQIVDVLERHPQSQKELKGRIPLWPEVQNAADKIINIFPQTRYLGLDFVVTDQNTVKLLEINSLTSLDSIQLDQSILETENGKWFFEAIQNEENKKR